MFITCSGTAKSIKTGILMLIFVGDQLKKAAYVSNTVFVVMRPLKEMSQKFYIKKNK